MPKYLWNVSYTAEGVRGLLAEGGTSRRATITDLAAKVGGSVEAFYYLFGSDDVIVIADMPDDATAAAVSLAVSASGAASVRTTVLLPSEVIDEAAKKDVGYRAPGA